MANAKLKKFAKLIEDERDALLRRWRQQVRKLPSASDLDLPTLNDHVPSLIDEFVEVLRADASKTIAEALVEGSPITHGIQRFQDGFDIVEVVAEYNILRGSLYELAEDHGLVLSGKAFHILNRILDEAIGLAVQTFSTQQALEVQRRREEYLSFVAHDLRTPLNAVSLATNVLQFKYGDQGASDTDQMLRSLRRNVNHLHALVDKVLKESAHIDDDKQIQVERRDFDLWPLVESLIQDLGPLARPVSVKLINEIPEDLIAYADAGLVHRVFQNLLANAILYTPRGEISIGAARAEDGAVECWVKDNGAGIPEERIETIFDKLQTDPTKDGGTGIGLAVVKCFVEAHGGTVSVISEEGVGTRFSFTLPSCTTEPQ